MTTNYREPWTTSPNEVKCVGLLSTGGGEPAVWNSDGIPVAACMRHDAERIVACVNVCAGMDISDVEIAIREWKDVEDMW